ncbi:hypothetical protein CCUS01_04705 [Colletotrichum cuscutae]|uniref:WD domain-containing protein n=1 Tax=Colletotrichum cuscutae TaxID=1209917 RepID=A0AAI9Y6J5_9PEZI|nr:hypothetical protein CCUS01_04705 [Colletotrichum cuscutae]
MCAARTIECHPEQGEDQQIIYSGFSMYRQGVTYCGSSIAERRTGNSVLKIKYEEPNRPEWTDVSVYMDISVDKRFLAAGSRCDIRVWNTSTRALTWVMSDSHMDEIYSICFSPDAQRIISASYASTIKVWDLSIIGEAVPNFPDDDARNLVCADEDHFAAYYPEMKKIRLWGRRPNIPESRFYEELVSAIALSQDNQQLALTTFNKTTITIWNISTRAITIKVCGRTEHICFDAHDEVADDDYVERQRKRSKRMPEVDSLTFGNASQLFSSLGGLIKIWKTSNGSCSHTIASGHSFATDITFSSQGQRFACLASDGQGIWKGVIQVWDVVTKQCISTLSLEQPSVYSIRSLSFSADMQQHAFSVHHVIRSYPFHLVGILLWDLKSGSLIRTLISDKIPFIEVRFDTRFVNRLHTEYGFIDISNSLGASSSDSIHAGSRISGEDLEQTLDSERSEAMPSFRGYGLSRDQEWIVHFRRSDSNVDDNNPGIDGLNPVRMYFTE